MGNRSDCITPIQVKFQRQRQIHFFRHKAFRNLHQSHPLLFVLPGIVTHSALDWATNRPLLHILPFEPTSFMNWTDLSKTAALTYHKCSILTSKLQGTVGLTAPVDI